MTLVVVSVSRWACCLRTQQCVDKNCWCQKYGLFLVRADNFRVVCVWLSRLVSLREVVIFGDIDF